MRYDSRNQRGTKKEHRIILTNLAWTKGKIIPEVYFLDAKWWTFGNEVLSEEGIYLLKKKQAGRKEGHWEIK